MRKRSKYRPKGVIMNPIAYVMESMTPVAKHDNFLIDLKIKNHMAMTNLTQGRATREDMDTLIPMANFVEALYRMGFGRDYATEVHKGLDALHAVGKRGAESGRFILRSEEMRALNTLMELHDAQMDVITVKDMERAFKIVDEEYKQRRMRLLWRGNMTDDERNLDLMVAELESENRLMRARNERLQRELDQALDDNARFKVTLERIIAVSKLAFRDGVSERVGEVGTQEPQGASNG
jgi:hypothetical protein